MAPGPRIGRLLARARALADATRPEPRALREALDRRWAELPPGARFRAQSIGRRTAGCEGTRGVFPRCDLACTPCYHSREANRVQVEGAHTVAEIEIDCAPARLAMSMMWTTSPRITAWSPERITSFFGSSEIKSASVACSWPISTGI